MIAVTVTTEVMSVPELVMNALEPLITQSPPSKRAVVRVAPASDPPPGSVRPKAPSRRPAHRAGSQCWRCSSVPNRKIGIVPSETLSSRVIATEESTRASSSRARHKVK